MKESPNNLSYTVRKNIFFKKIIIIIIMSTAWYRPRHVARCVRRWSINNNTTTNTTSTTVDYTNGGGGGSSNTSNSRIKLRTRPQRPQRPQRRRRRSIEIWDTTCIVTNLASTKPSTAVVVDTATSTPPTPPSSPTPSPTPSPSSSQTTTIPTKFQILINPANPTLSGPSEFPYFPKGGPLPSTLPSKDSHPIMGYVTQWGGMSVGNGMFFSAMTVDGLVHQHYCSKNIHALQEQCRSSLQEWWKQKKQSVDPSKNQDVSLLPEGQAVVTPIEVSSPSSYFLTETSYRSIVHVVPPFYNINNNQVVMDVDVDGSSSSSSRQLLYEAYLNAIHICDALQDEHEKSIHEPRDSSSSSTSLSQSGHSHIVPLRVACPLLGAGCRGFPLDEAIHVASKASVDWMLMFKNNMNMRGDKGVVGFDSGIEFEYDNDSDNDNDNDNNNNNDDERNEEVVLAFGIPSGEVRNQLVEAIDDRIDEIAQRNEQ